MQADERDRIAERLEASIRAAVATAEQALDAGVPRRDVWLAVCDDFGVPPERRHGREPVAKRRRPA